MDGIAALSISLRYAVDFFQDMDIFSSLDKFHRQDLEDNIMQRFQIYCTSELRN